NTANWPERRHQRYWGQRKQQMSVWSVCADDRIDPFQVEPIFLVRRNPETVTRFVKAILRYCAPEHLVGLDVAPDLRQSHRYHKHVGALKYLECGLAYRVVVDVFLGVVAMPQVLGELLTLEGPLKLLQQSVGIYQAFATADDVGVDVTARKNVKPVELE